MHVGDDGRCCGDGNCCGDKSASDELSVRDAANGNVDGIVSDGEAALAESMVTAERTSG